MIFTLSLPLYLFLIIYLIMVVIVGIFVAVNIYHIFLSASFGLPSFLTMFFVLASFILTLIITFGLLVGTNWSDPAFTINIPTGF